MAIEGGRKNVISNVNAPIAGSRLTETIWPEEVLIATSPDFIVPLVVKLCAQESTENGSVIEAGAGWLSKVRYQRTQGLALGTDSPILVWRRLQS